VSSSTPATDFAAWLAATFGADLRLDLGPLVPGSEAPLPIVPEFRGEPGDYALAGHWGRGGASEAVYVVERRGRHRAFLRLPWAGVYGDPELDAARVREVLTAWSTLRERLHRTLASSEIVSDMQNERADLTWPDGAAAHILGPTPLHPDRPPFWTELAATIA
jgi:hypothetical protein